MNRRSINRLLLYFGWRTYEDNEGKIAKRRRKGHGETVNIKRVHRLTEFLFIPAVIVLPKLKSDSALSLLFVNGIVSEDKQRY